MHRAEHDEHQHDDLHDRAPDIPGNHLERTCTGNYKQVTAAYDRKLSAVESDTASDAVPVAAATLYTLTANKLKVFAGYLKLLAAARRW